MTKKPDFLKHKEGPKRQARLNEWYLNQESHRDAEKYFTSKKGGIPNNPENFHSFKPDNDVVVRKNPYGDAEQIAKAEFPAMVKPDQWGDKAEPLKPKSGFDRQPHIGWGKAPKSEPKGMNTGLSRFGSGPQRNVSRFSG
jgi:hypothetical protein